VDESQKLLLTVVVVILVLGAIGAGLYFNYQKLQEANAELEKKMKKAKELQDVVEVQMPKVKRTLAEKRQLVAQYEETLPSATEIESMDETLNQYKNESGVRLLERRPVREASRAKEENTQSYYKYSYRLSLQADFFSWVEFVRLLETHERFIQVDEFTVRKESDEPEVLDVDMKISTFSYAKVQQAEPLEETPAEKQAGGGSPQGGS